MVVQWMILHSNGCRHVGFLENLRINPFGAVGHVVVGYIAPISNVSCVATLISHKYHLVINWVIWDSPIGRRHGTIRKHVKLRLQKSIKPSHQAHIRLFISITIFYKMWGILCRMLSVLQNIVMDMNNVMHLEQVDYQATLGKAELPLNYAQLTLPYQRNFRPLHT